MSLILDALNRSRDDLNPVPNLATHHPVESISPGIKHTLLWVALAVALLLIAWLVVGRFTESPAPAEDIGAPVAELTQNIGSAAASVTTELKARAAAHEKEVQPTVAAAQPVEEIESSAAVIDETKTAKVSKIESSENATAVVAMEPVAPRPATDNAAVARLYQNRDAVDDIELPSPNARTEGRPKQTQPSSSVADSPNAGRNEQPIDIEEVLQRAQEEVDDDSLDDHPVPFLSNLSQQSKDDIPTLYYQRHDYSVDPSISSIVLNGKKVTVGGSPISGIKVDEILTDSVVLSYRGTQFRLRALNSWINL
jgi:general secretion pathway protein B